MQALPSGPRLDRIALKWHDLAQRRLDYYTELYRSGRWRHYYTQERFALRMLDVISAAKKFGALAGLESEAAVRPAPRDEAMRGDIRRDDTRRDDTMRPAA
jgi:hypothetical protein